MLNDYVIRILAADRAAHLHREADAWRLARAAAAACGPASRTARRNLSSALGALTATSTARRHGVATRTQCQHCAC